MRRVAGGLPAAARRTALHGGEVLIFAPPPAPWRRVLRRALALIVDVYGDGAQAACSHRLAPDAFAERARELQRRFAADAQARAAFHALSRSLDPDARVFRDHLFLRVLPPADSGHQRVPPLHPHRDTWGSRLLAQENWWAPVLPVSRLNTLALYPAWWGRPLANESTSWDFDAYRARRRVALAAGRPVDYPSAPRALQPVPAREAQPLLLAVGELACFSGAQLHASLANRSGVTRFSIETRTVTLAPSSPPALPPGPVNVDTASRPPHLEWFRDADGVTLAQALAD